MEQILPWLTKSSSCSSRPGVGLDSDSWGIDHGTWSVLVQVFPDADVPAVQLSINATKPFEYHLEIDRRVALLRYQDSLIVGSGNVVHNLRRVDWSQPGRAYDWALRFDEKVTQIMNSSPGDILSVFDDDCPLAVPTPDHFIPCSTSPAWLTPLNRAPGSSSRPSRWGRCL